MKDRNVRWVVAFAVGVAAVALAPSSASANTSGTVSGALSVAAPCLTIDQPNIDFGTKHFNTSPTTNVFAQAPQQPAVQNCSGSDQRLLAAGSNATGPAVSWQLASIPPGQVNHCPQVDTYTYQLGNLPDGTSHELSTSDNEVGHQAAGEVTPFSHTIVMPCVGSGGAGTVMNTIVTFTAVF